MKPQSQKSKTPNFNIGAQEAAFLPLKHYSKRRVNGVHLVELSYAPHNYTEINTNDFIEIH